MGSVVPSRILRSPYLWLGPSVTRCWGTGCEKLRILDHYAALFSYVSKMDSIRVGRYEIVLETLYASRVDPSNPRGIAEPRGLGNVAPFQLSSARIECGSNSVQPRSQERHEYATSISQRPGSETCTAESYHGAPPLCREAPRGYRRHRRPQNGPRLGMSSRNNYRQETRDNRGYRDLFTDRSSHLFLFHELQSSPQP